MGADIVTIHPFPRGDGSHEIQAFGPSPTTSVKALQSSLSFSMLWTQGNQGTSKKSLQEPRLQNQCQCCDVMDGFNMSKLGMHASYFYYSGGIVNVVILLNMSFLHVQY